MGSLERLFCAGVASRAGRWVPLGLCVGVSGVLWGLLLVVPGGLNFPVIDDWAFARGAFLFAGGKGVHYFEWASMPQLGQWLWATPFVWVLGERFAALRASTLVLSWLGLWGFYDLLRQESWPRGRAAFGALALALNATFFLLQGTFMTDVPALSMALVALALYGRHRGDGDLFRVAKKVPVPFIWAAAACVATLAVATRQNMLVVPLSAGVFLWLQPGLRGRAFWLAGVGLPLVVGLAIYAWFRARPDIRPFDAQLPKLREILFRPFQGLHVLGLAVLPVVALGGVGRFSKTFAVALVIVLVGSAYWYSAYGPVLYATPFPYWPEGGTPPPPGGEIAQAVAALAGCGGAAALLTGLARRWRQRRGGPLLCFAALQIPLLFVAPSLLDRYLLMLMPAAILVADVGPDGERRSWMVGVSMLAVCGALAVCVTHDCLAWNQARWTLGRRAVRTIHPWEIEGGLEWDGWHAPEPRPKGVTYPDIPRYRLMREWFPYITGRYALLPTVPAGAVRLDSEPYRKWLPPGEDRMYLVRQWPRVSQGRRGWGDAP